MIAVFLFEESASSRDLRNYYRTLIYKLLSDAYRQKANGYVYIYSTGLIRELMSYHEINQ